MAKAKNQALKDLHCGACMKKFDDVSRLTAHTDNCPAAKTMLPIIYQIWLGDDKVGHPLAHFISLLHENAILIQRYAYAVADNMDVLLRAKLHSRMCKNLGLEYKNFRPFESQNIIKQPSREEAEAILWDTLYAYIKPLSMSSVE